MSFNDRVYLNPRRVMVDPYTGETIVCSGDDASQHDPTHASEPDWCETCDDVVIVCRVHNRCISCCYCGNYHSMDCPWPL